MDRRPTSKPEVKKPLQEGEKSEHLSLHNTFIELKQMRRHLKKQAAAEDEKTVENESQQEKLRRMRKIEKEKLKSIDRLKAKFNDLRTEEYLATGRGRQNIARARREHLGKEEAIEQQMMRSAEVRKANEAEKARLKAEEAKAAEASLLGLFKKSLARMNERLFGKPPDSQTKTGSESSAERPE